MPAPTPHREPAAHPAIAFAVRWRFVIYLLLILAAVALARAGVEARRHAPPPPDVEADD